MVAPAEGEVGPAVDEEDCCAGWRGGVGEEVMPFVPADGELMVLDAGVVGGDFVRGWGGHGCGEAWDEGNWGWLYW